MGFQAIIFDLDGTLLDTLADIGDSVNLMLAEYGFPGHSTDEYRRFIGNGIRMLVTRALPIEGRSEKLVTACVRRAREIYWENWNRKTRPYDGIPDLLDCLKEKDLPLAVLSNKPHDFTVRYVNAYFGNWDFKVVMGQNDHFPVKPDPASALDIARQIGLAPEKFLFVGDSAVDMQTAATAGMYAVGVAWGFRGPEELRENGCRMLVNHPLEILPLLELR
ncbi:MAG: HAD family hydrolase [Deltaproteobacteria bacterium]|nr:HAD family hydrolase [Deltaproteobacteria bacterium]